MSTTSTLVATWTIGATATTPAESSFDIGPKADDPAIESVLFPDLRKRVNPADIAPGGKYRSIVKLQIRYENQAADDTRFAQGTGWLIKPDLLVTAGHCAYDHTYQFGRATEVKAWIGYNGKASVNTGNVQFRSGNRIATTKEWVTSDVNRAYDVSFIQLDRPFDGVTPIVYQPTQTNGKMTIGVVGYPADMTLDDEHGAQMYEMYKDINFDLKSSTLNMLEYTISSFAGQSGSPVMIQQQNKAIGVHVYGLGNKNSASVIRGTYGNIFGAYINSFVAPLSTATEVQGVKYLKDDTQPEDAFGATASATEDFWSVFKTVAGMTAKVGSTILSGGSPFLGPIAGPIAAAAGTAIGIAGQLINKPESDLAPAPDYKAHASRAILSEAALQTVLKMDVDQLSKYKISQTMFNSFQKNKANVGPISKKLAPALMDSALRISIAQANQPNTAETTATASYPNVPVPRTAEAAMDPNADTFASGIREAANDEDHEEGFLDFLGSVAQVGMKVLPVAIGAITKSLGVESSLEPEPNHDSVDTHVETLCHRSMMGEAALQALLTIPSEDMHAEGFFDSLVGAVKSIGSTVIRVAPSVIKTVAPLVISAVSGESALGNDKKGAAQPVKRPGIKHKKSVADLLNDMPLSGLESLDIPDVPKLNTVSVPEPQTQQNDLYWTTDKIPNGHD